MKSGWIKLHRRLLDNETYRHDPTAWRIFVHLLLNADENGTCSFGRKQLALQVGNNEMTVYKALKRLLVTGMVTQVSNNRFTTFSICNWSKYQSSGNSQSNSFSNTSGNNSGNNRVTHFKNKNNTKNKNILSNASVATNELLKLFEPVNPSYERLFSNTSQRAALERLVKKYGTDKVRNMLVELPVITAKKYAPRITTPLQLETKLGELVQFIKQEKSNQKGKVGMV